MKVNNNFFIIFIFILEFFTTSCSYNFEIIEELMSKTATFETRDFNTYKIYKYIPSCPKNNIYNKNIYLQLLGEAQNGHFYIHLYDNFDKIA